MVDKNKKVLYIASMPRYINQVGFEYEIITREEEQKLPGNMSTFLEGDYALYNFSTRMSVAWGTYEKCKEVLNMLMTPSVPQSIR